MQRESDRFKVTFTINSSTRNNEFRGFLSQVLTNFHEILHTPFFIYVVTTIRWKFLEVLIQGKYFLSYTIWHVIKFSDEANGFIMFIEGIIFIYSLACLHHNM